MKDLDENLKYSPPPPGEGYVGVDKWIYEFLR